MFLSMNFAGKLHYSVAPLFERNIPTALQYKYV